MLEIDRRHPAMLGDERLDVAVVIDVMRATTTAIALLARGARAVRVVATPADLAALPPPPAGARYLVFSELDASRASGLDCVDNSPALAESMELGDRLPVLVTTNGTRAIDAALAHARTVLVAGFVNLRAVAIHLARAQRVTLLPAGDFEGRDVRTEDERCADALEAVLSGGAPDLPALIEACWQDARIQRRLSRHPALARDMEIAVAVDRHPVVATAAPAAGGDGVELVRAAEPG